MAEVAGRRKMENAMTVEIIDCVQGSPEWFQARLGIPTASCFKDVLAKGEGKVRATYMRRLAGEIITGQPAETFKSEAMERGNQMEAEARANYVFGWNNTRPKLVGFMRRAYVGCSPDALLGDDGVLELKTQKPELLIATHDAKRFPPEHIAQCQGALLVTGRQWVDLCVYWPGMPMFVMRAERDETYIDMLMDELARFNDELQAMVARVRSYGQRVAA
jgi:YqaJ-like viral recombinase domain